MWSVGLRSRGRWEAKRAPRSGRFSATKFSPELVPGESADAQPSQPTEAVIGPFELQDFHLYYILRFGYAPPKVAFLAYCAWRDAALGSWPDIPEAARSQYDIAANQIESANFPDSLLRVQPVQAQRHPKRA